MAEQRVALVTAGNRGIGFEVCRQVAARGFIVLLTARDAAKAQDAVKKLGCAGNIQSLALDLADSGSISRAQGFISLSGEVKMK